MFESSAAAIRSRLPTPGGPSDEASIGNPPTALTLTLGLGHRGDER